MTKWNTIAYYHVCLSISIFHHSMDGWWCAVIVVIVVSVVCFFRLYFHIYIFVIAASRMKIELRWKSGLLRFNLFNIELTYKKAAKTGQMIHSSLSHHLAFMCDDGSCWMWISFFQKFRNTLASIGACVRFIDARHYQNPLWIRNVRSISPTLTIHRLCVDGSNRTDAILFWEARALFFFMIHLFSCTQFLRYDNIIASEPHIFDKEKWSSCYEYGIRKKEERKEIVNTAWKERKKIKLMNERWKKWTNNTMKKSILSIRLIATYQYAAAVKWKKVIDDDIAMKLQENEWIFLRAHCTASLRWCLVLYNR